MGVDLSLAWGYHDEWWDRGAGVLIEFSVAPHFDIMFPLEQ